MSRPRAITGPFSPDSPRRLLTDLCRLVAERAPDEVKVPADYEERNEAAKQQYEDAQIHTTQLYNKEKSATEEEYASVRRSIVARFESDHSAAQREYDKTRTEILTRFETKHRAAKESRDESRWEATTISEAAKGGSEMQAKEIKDELDARWNELQAIQRETVELLQERGQWRKFPEPQPTAPLPNSDPIRHFDESIVLAKKQFQVLAEQTLYRWFEGLRPLAFFLFLWGLTVAPAGAALNWESWYWVAASGGAAMVLFWIIGGWFYFRARSQATQAYLALRQTMVDAGLDRPDTLQAAKAILERQYTAIGERCRRELKKADDKFIRQVAELKRVRQNELREVDEKYPPLLSEITAQRDQQIHEADDKYSKRLSDIHERYRSETERIEAEYARATRESEQRYRHEWSKLTERWRRGMQRYQSSVDQMNRECDRLFPDWNGSQWGRWAAASTVPPAIRFGQHQIALERIENGIPRDESLRPDRTDYTMPALLPFPTRSLLLLRAAGGEGKAKAIEVIQSIMLRMLTAIPPSRVRFTIIDPVGLGENFSAFMHLADYDDQLVANRIWTDPAHIEQRLTDLTEHMENVIQLYLRNEFETIDEYNELAGEMAEPYRVLVVANFPANFTEGAGRRLASIVASGARCGVFTIMSYDNKLQLPREFDMADLLPHALELKLEDDTFIWKHPEFGELALEYPEPPPAEQFTEIVRRVGHEVQDAENVEVPFATVAPESEQWWTSDSRAGLDVPLGRAGAKKLQSLNLGHGTSQHVLVAGKTGSGKSTLWHALITNAALRYSPDEVELYLIDFKKGVEFKTYATCELPHARVIAIESEREFGLSVLERLDAELRHRGDLFRKLGVQDVKGYRAAEPDAVLPRVLFIVDEFQELFVEDDRIAQEASLLLDRLVRQGRAFGIHVLLGSQTLAGAYSLARSTIGQMAVRIALQCSESDAHLILSEENTAARLLTRPGEAIYNDANGLYEGNHPFQVVWLPDREREEWLQRLQQYSKQHHQAVKAPIVFEGNIPADPTRNPQLGELLSASAWPKEPPAVCAWLGSAVAIKDPTAARFVRQSGSNLLLVGHREEAALGVMSNCLFSLASQHTPAKAGAEEGSASFYIFDGIRPDAPEAGFWHRVAPSVPHDTKLTSPRDVPAALGEIADEVARREEAADSSAPRIYLLIYNLGRFRDLRKEEDGFSFSSYDDEKPASPASLFEKILREGPAFGVHTIVWCDTYNNVSRSLDRQAMREFEMRVLFHMNATDSSNLIDSPAAARLGVHRAIFYDEGEGQIEKFRPYSLPTDQWLDHVKRQLHGRSTDVPTASSE